MKTFKSLVAFYSWFRDQPLLSLPIQADGGTQYNFDGMIIQGIVLCRFAPYQVELFVGHGPGFVPEHRHPNVDSLEVAVSGDVRFVVDGALKLTKAMLESNEDGTLKALGAMVRVRPNAWHGAIVGATGGSFLSVQHWLNDRNPTSVAHDWENPS